MEKRLRKRARVTFYDQELIINLLYMIILTYLKTPLPVQYSHKFKESKKTNKQRENLVIIKQDISTV